MANRSEASIARRREDSRVRMAKLRAADPEKFRERSRQDYAKNRDKRIAQNLARKRERYQDGRYAHVQRERWLKTKYDLTPEDFAMLVLEQNGRCAVCDAGEPGGRGSWHIDHDHETGKVRGLLCLACNVAIGQAGESPDRLLALAMYVLRSRSIFTTLGDVTHE